METYTMLQTAIALFCAAALGGLVMAGMRFSGTPRPPAWLAMGHGLLAAAGLTLLIYAALTVGVPRTAQIAAVLFVVAAAGGTALNLLYHSKLLPLSKPLLVAHAALAVSGLVLLLITVFGSGHF